MIDLLHFDQPIIGDHGRRFHARVLGGENANGHWVGWIEYVDGVDEAIVLRTGRETTQPNLLDLEYWASALTRIYVASALSRAMAGAPHALVEPHADRMH